MELRLSGLVVKQQGRLKVYNRLYERIFEQSWINTALANLKSSQDIDSPNPTSTIRQKRGHLDRVHLPKYFRN
jgi:hypothetical protein